MSNYFVLKNTGIIRKSLSSTLPAVVSNSYSHREKSACVHTSVSVFLGCWEMERRDWLKVKFSQCL
jgi:hypothetical protein